MRLVWSRLLAHGAMGVALWTACPALAQLQIDGDLSPQALAKRALEFDKLGQDFLKKRDFKNAVEAFAKAIVSDPKIPGRFVNSGRANYLASDIKEAINNFDEAIALDPSLAAAYDLRGRAFLTSKNYELAIADFDKAVQLEPGNVGFLASRGEALIKVGQHERAIKDFDRLTQLNPTDSGHFVQRGIAYSGKGENDRAIADFDQAIRFAPRLGRAFGGRGLAYLAKGDIERAIADFNEAVKLQGASRPAVDSDIHLSKITGEELAAAYANRGAAYLRKGEIDRAGADLDEAIRRDPDQIFSRVLRATIYQFEGKPERAIVEFAEAIRRDPEDAALYNRRGLAYAAAGEVDKAFFDFDAAIRTDPTLAAAYYNRGQTRRAGGEDGLAIGDFGEAIRRDPNNALAYLARASLHRRKGDYDRAIADYDETLRLAPGDPLAFYGRGVSHAAMRKMAEAIADFDEAIRIDSRAGAVYAARGLVRAAQGNIELAIADISTAIALDPDDASRRIARAQLSLKLDRPHFALVDVERAVAIDPDRSAAYLMRAQILERLGQSDEALADRRRAAEVAQNSAVANQGIRRLAPKDTFQDCDVCPEMVIVPGGSFMMGSPETENRRTAHLEGPQLRVTIAWPLAIGKFEITVDQFATFVADTGHNAATNCFNGFAGLPSEQWNENSWRNPGHPTRGDHPVQCVSWHDAKSYTAWLSRKTGRTYRLLTEAEWEYAARAGTVTAYYFGDDETDICRHGNIADRNWRDLGREGSIPEFARKHTSICDDGYAFSSPVGSFPPNLFGLYDMIGNVEEWLEDCFHHALEGAPIDGSAWIKNCERRSFEVGTKRHITEKISRSIRGGNWYKFYFVGRSAEQQGLEPGDGSAGTGFRVATDGPIKTVATAQSLPALAPIAAPSSTITAPLAPANECTRAETHWKSAEEIKSLAVYEDHLKRFPNCDFAALAAARIRQLRK